MKIQANIYMSTKVTEYIKNIFRKTMSSGKYNKGTRISPSKQQKEKNMAMYQKKEEQHETKILCMTEVWLNLKTNFLSLHILPIFW